MDEFLDNLGEESLPNYDKIQRKYEIDKFVHTEIK